jgi:two-component system copper resistance phosphate regulon response regulator CusR
MSVRILVVEDDDEIADFLLDGKDGWHHLQSGGWDVILMDWWLPGTDGLQLLKRFRQVDQVTPVLFLTAKDAVSDRVKGLDNGANDYLCKPFAFEELIARIRVLVRTQGQSTSTLVSYQDVRVDLATHRAERAGQRLDLTAKEQALLVFLLRHPNEVVTRTRIYEQVWDERYDGLSNTLEVHVMELRRKLEAHGPRLIHTLRNRGYLLGQEPK